MYLKRLSINNNMTTLSEINQVFREKTFKKIDTAEFPTQKEFDAMFDKILKQVDDNANTLKLALGNTLFLDNFGVVGDGSVDDTVNMQTAFEQAELMNMGISGTPGANYHITQVIVTRGSVPRFIDFMGSTITKLPGGDLEEPALLVENPHSIVDSGFMIKNLTIDGDFNTNKCIEIHGSRDGLYTSITTTNSLDKGFAIRGEEGHGVYSNKFTDIVSTKNEGDGIHAFTFESEATTRVASNTFINCTSKFNKNNGWFVDRCSGLYLGCRTERNNNYGIYIDETYDFTWIGGYSENNHKNVAISIDDDDLSTDEMLYMTANATGVTVFGGRLIGDIDYSTNVETNHFIATRNSNTFSVGPAGDAECHSITLGDDGGIAFGTAAMKINALSAATGFAFHVSGKNALRLHSTGDNTETYVDVRFIDEGGTDRYRRLIIGAPDSDGTGYRSVRMEN